MSGAQQQNAANGKAGDNNVSTTKQKGSADELFPPLSVEAIAAVRAETARARREQVQKEFSVGAASSSSSLPVVVDGAWRPEQVVRTDLALPDAGAGGRVSASFNAYTLDGVLTARECAELVALSSDDAHGGYRQALVNVGFGRQQYMPDVRNNDRWIWDSPAQAAVLFDRLRPHLPATITVGSDVWDVVELNERLRFLRYTKGMYFAQHQDGTYVRDSGPKRGDRSFVTVQIYLNDVDANNGGATTFLSHRSDARVECRPRTGRVLIFHHPLLHEGSELLGGEKFTIRTDTMYRKRTVKRGE